MHPIVVRVLGMMLGNSCSPGTIGVILHSRKLKRNGRIAITLRPVKSL